jgi:hypothetical protein
MSSDSRGLGWHFFLDRDGAIAHSHLEPGEGETTARLATRALAEFEVPLRGVERLVVVATGEFVGLDFQALVPDSVLVVHGLGLGEAPKPAPWRGVVGVHGSGGGLVHVERELDIVREALADWTLVEWSASGGVQPDLLHFAGHGQRVGTTGWRSALRLSEAEWLTSGEVIAGQRSARVVVLGACAAGMTSPEAIDGGMNMAVAFLLAGAEMVIAPDHDVDDASAVELAQSLYSDAPPAARAADLRNHLMARLARAKASDPRFHGWRIWVR